MLCWYTPYNFVCILLSTRPTHDLYTSKVSNTDVSVQVRTGPYRTKPSTVEKKKKEEEEEVSLASFVALTMYPDRTERSE